MSFSSFSLSRTSTTLTLKRLIALQRVSVSILFAGVNPFIISPDEKTSGSLGATNSFSSPQISLKLFKSLLSFPFTAKANSSIYLKRYSQVMKVSLPWKNDITSLMLSHGKVSVIVAALIFPGGVSSQEFRSRSTQIGFQSSFTAQLVNIFARVLFPDSYEPVIRRAGPTCF